MRRLLMRAFCFFALFGFTSLFVASQTVPSILYTFTSSAPNALIQAQDGNFYGTTYTGGSSIGNGACLDASGTDVGCGMVFKLTPAGALTTLYDFCSQSNCSDGSTPTGLLQGGDGNFYGTTTFGGLNTGYCLNGQNADVGCGTIFKLSLSGQITTVHSFIGGTPTGGVADGAFPNPLVMGNGGFYGSTLSCSANTSTCNSLFTYGTVFSFTTAQDDFQVLYSFGGSDGNASHSGFAYPNSLVQGSDGNLYGTTQLGGSFNCLLFNENSFGCGGIFEYSTSTSAESDLAEFQNNSSPGTSPPRIRPDIIIAQPGGRFPTGGNPWTFQNIPISLTEGSDQNFYGTTPPACVSSAGYSAEPSPSCQESTIFQYIPSSTTLNTLYTFSGDTSGVDGGGSTAGLTLASDGNYYGLSGSDVFQITPSGISFSYGTFSSLAYLPNLMMEGSDGNFYGTAISSSGAGGAVFKIAATPALEAPVQLNFSSPQIAQGSSVKASWSVSNSFSTSAQQCYAFVQNGTLGAGSWAGLQTGTFSNKFYSGSATITPTQIGSFAYALTCGGTESGFASLTVAAAPLQPSVSSNPTSITITSPGGTGSAQLTFSNFSSASFSVSCSGLPSEAACSLVKVSTTSATLQITTTAASTAVLERRASFWNSLCYVCLLPGLACFVAKLGARKGVGRLFILTALVAVALLFVGCGGGGNTGNSISTGNSNPGTPTGSSPVQVTVTAGADSASVGITVVIQ